MRWPLLIVTAALVVGCEGQDADAPGPFAGGRPTASASGTSTSSSAPTRAPAPIAASPAPTSTPHPAVSVTSVAGVRIGTPAAEAERRLRRVLGQPRSSPLPGCYGESGRSLTWGTLTVYLSNRGSGSVVLSGWTVAPGESRFRYALPYDIEVGDRVRLVLERVPESTGGVAEEGPYTGSYLARTPRHLGLFWSSRMPGDGGVVDEVSFQAEGCD